MSKTDESQMEVPVTEKKGVEVSSMEMLKAWMQSLYTKDARYNTYNVRHEFETGKVEEDSGFDFDAEDFDPHELYEVLKSNLMLIVPVMNSSFSGKGVNALRYALNTSISNGRVKMVYHPQNYTSFENIFRNIQRTEAYHEANVLMLDFFKKYTFKRSDSKRALKVI